MASKELNVKVKHRYDTASNWTTNNPVLLAGELGIESDTKKIKVGDGVNTWASLDYASGSYSELVAIKNEYLKNAYIGTEVGNESVQYLYITKQDGTQVVFSNGGGGTTGGGTTGGVSTEMLWEASASEQTSNFGAWSRTLKDNDCDVFEIGYRYNTSYNFVKSVFVPAIAGQRTLLDFVNTPVMLFVRAVTIDSKTQISFASSYFGNTAGESADNSTIIPIFVRGWKFN